MKAVVPLKLLVGLILYIFLVPSSCLPSESHLPGSQQKPAAQTRPSDFFSRLSDSALTLTLQIVQYDPTYIRIDYPNGDVPPDRGVCCDVVIRAYRKLGIDLQQRVHEDMLRNFAVYPQKWGLPGPDANIDHRRVPNLMCYFNRQQASLPISQDAANYQAGELVCWNLGGGQTHIGLLVHLRSNDNKRNLVVHNIGGGQVLADCLFQFPIIGHYRYQP